MNDLRVILSLLIIAAGVVVWGAWRARQITRVKRLTHALQTMEQTLRTRIDELTTERNQATAILDSMAEGVIAVDPQGRILLMNPTAGMLLDIAPAKAIGQSVFETVRHPEAQALVRAVLQNRERATKDIALFQPKERALRLHGVPCEGSGTGALAIVVIQDVTETNRYEQLRKEFVANVSHELKSPLTSIRGLTETLLGGALADAANNRRFVQLIDEDAARLSRLIEDLLALSQIESQAIPLKLSIVELRPLIESIVTSLQPGLSQRRITTTLELAVGLAVRADPDRLRQVVLNLIENAIKYNRELGAIVVSASANGAWVTVTVADTGIGIPEQALPRIFERFYRVDKARSRELGGTGLGLAIVRHIVEAHGGNISVDSTLNHGSKFSFTVPFAS